MILLTLLAGLCFGIDIRGSGVTDGSITTAKIATGAVDTDKLASDAVTSAKIIAGGVGTTDLADSAVDTAKLGSGSVNTGKILLGAVGTNAIQDNAIDTAKLATDSVTSAKIAGGTIATSDIANGAIDTDKLGSGSVDTSKLKGDAGGFGAWSTWTPTFTGFSADPTGYTARYARFGNFVVAMYFTGSVGTSNTTGFTITLPVAAKSAAMSGGLIVYDNTAWAQPGCLQTAAASTTLTLQKTCGTNASWTGSGSKDTSFILLYEAN